MATRTARKVVVGIFAPAREALPKLLAALRAKGYELVTVSELMCRAKGSEGV